MSGASGSSGVRGGAAVCLRPVLWGLAAACIVSAGLLCALAGLMTAKDIPPQAVPFLCVVCAAAGCLCGGWIAAWQAREKGLVMGLACAGSAFLVLLIVALCRGESPSMFAAVKLFSMLLAGAVGGVAGVNRRARRH